MPGRLSLSTPMPKLAQAQPNLSPLPSPRALTPDENGVSNSGRAAGGDLIARTLADTNQVNGLGGKVDLLA